jgi:hypothetical protein
LPAELRSQFDRDGFILVRDALPAAEFARLQKEVLESEFDCRSHVQGDTVTRRVAVGPDVKRRIPQLAKLLRDESWRGLMAYAASTRNRPLYYIQTIAGGVTDGPLDPQLQLHSDTFHPSLKAWLFLTDVEEDGRPLTYVAGSHRLTPERIAWERRKSIDVLERGDRLSQRGSFRINANELSALGLPPPTRFCVPANTLVIIDTCGFHARANSHRPSVRVELWAYCRRNPFLAWTGGGLLSWPAIADRRSGLLMKALDWLDRHALGKQHWKPDGSRRPVDA